MIGPELIAAIVSPVIIRLVSKYILQSKRKTKISISFPDGSTEELRVGSRADSSEIESKVQEALSFNDKIESTLRKVSKELGVETPHRGKDVDFMIHAGGKEIAIEAKSSGEDLKKADVRRYIKALPPNGKLYMVLGSIPPKDTLESTYEIGEEGGVHFIFGSTDDIEQELRVSLTNDISDAPNNLDIPQ